MSKSIKLIGIKIYIITLVFASLSIFLQLLPVDTASHFQSSLAINPSNFVYLASLFFIPYSIMQLPGGLLLDKYGLKYVLPISTSIVTFSIALYWGSTSTWMIGFSRILAGLGCSVAYISGIYVAANFFHNSKLPILISLIEVASTIGSLIAANPLRHAIVHYGWQQTGAVIISCSVIICVLSMVFVKNAKPNKNAAAIDLVQACKDAFGLLRKKSMLFIFGYSFCTWLVIMSFAGYWFADYMSVVHKYSETTALELVEVYWMGFLISSIIVGYFTNSSRVAKTNLLLLAAIGFITYTLMCIPIRFNYVGILLVALFGGVSASGVIIAFSLIPKLVNIEQCGTAIATNNTFVVLGGYVGQVLFSMTLKNINVNNYWYIVKDTGIGQYYYSALLIYFIFTLLALIFALFIVKDLNTAKVEQLQI